MYFSGSSIPGLFPLSFQSVCRSLSFFFFIIIIFFIFSVPYTSNIPITSMTSYSSRKRRECTPSPFEGEDSSSSAQNGSHEVTGRPALPLRDPWYTPSLFFPQVSYGEALPSTYAWVFSRQEGFVGSAQVPNPREIFDLQIRRGLQEVVPIFFYFVVGKI